MEWPGSAGLRQEQDGTEKAVWNAVQREGHQCVRHWNLNIPQSNIPPNAKLRSSNDTRECYQSTESQRQDKNRVGRQVIKTPCLWQNW